MRRLCVRTCVRVRSGGHPKHPLQVQVYMCTSRWAIGKVAGEATPVSCVPLKHPRPCPHPTHPHANALTRGRAQARQVRGGAAGCRRHGDGGCQGVDCTAPRGAQRQRQRDRHPTRTPGGGLGADAFQGGGARGGGRLLGLNKATTPHARPQDFNSMHPQRVDTFQGGRAWGPREESMP